MIINMHNFTFISRHRW